MSILLKNLGKTYNDSQWVLRNINVKVHQGEFFVIVGPSGSGKSTLLRMIAGLTPVSAGQILIDGQDVTNLTPKERHLTMVFQSYALFPFLNVEENVAFGLKIKKLPQAEIKRRVDNALKMNNLEQLRKRKPRELSGGQRQRVAIARAIASHEGICLMDEPLSNLDPMLQVKMRSRIHGLQRKLGLTIVYVTHNQIEAMTMADRIMVIHDHKLQQLGTPTDIYEHPANDFVAGFFGTPAMNILPFTQVQESSAISIDPYLHFEAPTELKRGKYELGIRPQYLAIDTAANEANGMLTNIEYRGANVVLDIKLDDQQDIQVLSEPGLQLKVGQRLAVYPDGKFFIFGSNHQLLCEGGTSHEKKIVEI